MGDIEWDVEGIDKTIAALIKGLKIGTEDAGENLIESGQEVAEDSVAGTRVWTGQVRNSFETIGQSDFPAGYNGTIVNPTEHAKVVDVGLAPRGEITGSNPSVQDLMPWVVSNLSPATYYDEGGSSSGSNDGGGGDGGTSVSEPGSIRNEESQYTLRDDLDKFGLDGQDFESDFVKAGNMEDGSKVLWKTHNDPDFQSDFKVGVIKNEVVWSKVQRELGYDLGPDSRVENVQLNENVSRSGTLNEFVEGKQLTPELNSIYTDNDDYEYERHEFIQKHREWSAKTNALDYLLGNGDRHANNVRLNENGEPRGIDNGGNEFNENLDQRKLVLFRLFYHYEDSTDRDQLRLENEKLLDKTESVLENIITDEERRQQIIESVADVHGEDSKYYDRIERILGENIGEGHALKENENGVPRYKQDIQWQRDRHDSHYEDAINNGDGQTDDGESLNPEDINEELDNLLGDL